MGAGTGCAAEHLLRQGGRPRGTRHSAAGTCPGDVPPSRKRAGVLRHRGVGSPTTGGVDAIGGSKREAAASERRRSGT